jgi:hypothetical protein
VDAVECMQCRDVDATASFAHPTIPVDFSANSSATGGVFRGAIDFTC